MPTGKNDPCAAGVKRTSLSTVIQPNLFVKPSLGQKIFYCRCNTLVRGGYTHKNLGVTYLSGVSVDP